ncbi:MAG: putative phage tail protein [Parvibaculum sedimenti]|uniref:YmfQ family protein n=1 Tax=Parvibaculum sedimenti TaxID=2608632 RepID=UPI003BB7BD01
MTDRSEQYASLWLQLAPRGRAWARGLASSFRRLGLALGAEFSRIHARAENLLVEAHPATTDELLSDWEAFAGLPDPCNPLEQNRRERLQALKGRLTDIGGASVDRYMRIASALGYDVTLEKFRPFEFGRSAFGGRQECGDASLRARLRMTVHGPRVTRFEFGMSHFGEPMARIARAEDLECRLDRIAHSHLKLEVGYQGA